MIPALSNRDGMADVSLSLSFFVRTIRLGQLVQGGQILQLPRHATGQHRKPDGKRPAGKAH